MHASPQIVRCSYQKTDAVAHLVSFPESLVTLLGEFSKLRGSQQSVLYQYILRNKTEYLA